MKTARFEYEFGKKIAFHYGYFHTVKIVWQNFALKAIDGDETWNCYLYTIRNVFYPAQIARLCAQFAEEFLARTGYAISSSDIQRLQKWTWEQEELRWEEEKLGCRV